ncbi:MAG: glutamine synthetase III [Bacteroidales bacterium]|nr:glutamine synthetase III [Bacteroidales bacterium]
MGNLRTKIVLEAFKKKAVELPAPENEVSSWFGELVFNREKMRRYLDPATYDALTKCIDDGSSLDLSTADKVAAGMKQWALEHGVTHITHWFQPLTDGTAEKHDSLIEYDGHGGVIESFTGKALVQQEPDASSFPNGGIRATFEARGYTAWDPASPVFIQDDTLCIPTVFVAYTGEALDFKTPLKRSIKAVSDAALPLCKLFDPEVKRIYAYLGWEQEYFLVDEDIYAARPDLMITGRTLMGHESSKNQQLDDHYFGAIPSRVAAFMKELETEGYKLGIPLKTRHKEVAPNQFEFAPIYGEMNLANDQNQQILNVMHKVARKHGFVVLLHEKPFAGVNGSGKHNNWSLGTDNGTNLFAPGKDAKGNLQFLTFFVNTLYAVQRHNGLLKAAIASATNAHRLGANEAPPAIVSAFVGRTMNDVLHKLVELPSGTPIEIAGKKGTSVGAIGIPEIFIDNTDRNRTSPFAFTGNRFEYRAVGSSANCAGAMITLNSAVAEQLMDFKVELDKALSEGKALDIAIMDTLKPLISKVLDTVCFEGNGYSEEWKKEAARRGLDTESVVPKMLQEYEKREAVEMFKRCSVFSEKELHARNEVKLETYVKKIQIEARVMGRMATNHIIPAAMDFQTRLLKNISLQKEILGADSASEDVFIAREISKLITEIRQKVHDITEARKKANKIEDMYKRALAYSDIADMIPGIRKPIDALEEIVDNASWPLPKYRELLFIS